jgi:hypothetical protein
MECREWHGVNFTDSADIVATTNPLTVTVIAADKENVSSVVRSRSRPLAKDSRAERNIILTSERMTTAASLPSV